MTKKILTEDIIKTEDIFKVTVKCLGRIYKAEGSDIDQVFDQIKISGGARAMSIITLEKNGVVREKILNGIHTNHLFGQGGPTSKEIGMKWVRSLFAL